MIKRTCLLTLLLAGCLVALLPQAYAASTCEDYIKIVQSCRDNVIGTYGQKIIVEKKGDGGKVEKNEIPCKKGDNIRKVCGTGHFCVRAPGTTFGVCHRGGALYRQYKTILTEFSNLCEPIFASRQSGAKGYLTCVENAKCDMKKFNDCRFVLKKEKKSGSSDALIGLLIFLVVSLLLEGLVLFGMIKIIDKHNPRNTVVRGLILGGIMGLISFPLVYSFPLLGMLLSGSVLFGLIIVFYQQDVFLPAMYTAFHILWVGYFFTFLVAAGNLGNDAWIAQPKTLRIKLLKHHKSFADDVDEFNRERKDQKASADDEKKTKEDDKKDDKKKTKEDDKK